MLYKIVALASCLFFILSLKASEKPLTINSRINTVTVYRSGAEVAHTAMADLSTGSYQLIVKDISNKIDLNSIRITCSPLVTIMGIEFSADHLSTPAATPAAIQLRDSIKTYEKQQETINVRITTINELIDVLKSNRDIKGSQNGLSVSELMKLMDYYKSKSEELQKNLAEQKDQQRSIKELISKLQRQLQEEEKKNTRVAGRLQLQISAEKAGKYEFAISYITPNASWTPIYDIRVENIRKPAQVIYKAKIQQLTGIDWTKVKLSLSSSMPSQWGDAPTLKAWFLAYQNLFALQGRVAGLAVNSAPSIQESSLQEIVVVGYGSTKNNEDKAEPELAYILNGEIITAREFAKIRPSAIKTKQRLNSDAASAIYGSRASGGAIVVTLKEGLEDYVSVSDNQLNINFDIDVPYDIPTNGKEQTATLREYDVATLYNYSAIPKLDRDAYLLAEIAEWEKLNLLPGEANIIMEGTYVGKTFIDPNSISDTLNLTLGRDKRVVVKKEKMEDFSSVRFLGSNKLQKFTYEISIKNNKKDTVQMQLKDQFPISTNKDIEVELLEHSNAEVDKETGIVNWKLQLAPGEQKKVRLSYSVRYPKDRQINLN